MILDMKWATWQAGEPSEQRPMVKVKNCWLKFTHLYIYMYIYIYLRVAVLHLFLPLRQEALTDHWPKIPWRMDIQKASTCSSQSIHASHLSWYIISSQNDTSSYVIPPQQLAFYSHHIDTSSWPNSNLLTHYTPSHGSHSHHSCPTHSRVFVASINESLTCRVIWFFHSIPFCKVLGWFQKCSCKDDIAVSSKP